MEIRRWGLGGEHFLSGGEGLATHFSGALTDLEEASSRAEGNDEVVIYLKKLKERISDTDPLLGGASLEASN